MRVIGVDNKLTRRSSSIMTFRIAVMGGYFILGLWIGMDTVFNFQTFSRFFVGFKSNYLFIFFVEKKADIFFSILIIWILHRNVPQFNASCEEFLWDPGSFLCSAILDPNFITFFCSLFFVRKPHLPHHLPPLPFPSQTPFGVSTYTILPA